MTTLNLTNICNRVHVAIKHSARALVTGSWLIAGTALAAPANDDFAAAIDLTGAGVGQTGDAITGNQTGTNTTAATLQASEPNPGASNTVWFKWTSPGNGDFTYRTNGSTDTGAAEWDAIIGIYTGAAVNALTPLGTTPKDTGSEETMTVPVTSGTTYYIQLAGWNGTEAANILLSWDFVATIYQANILTFGPGAAVGEVFVDAGTITWYVPSGTNLATLAPTFTLSPGATCNRTSGAVPSPNFSAGSVVYTVTSQDAGVVNYYTVNVVVGNLVKWNVAGGGDWDSSTPNWFKQPSGPVTTFADGDEVTFDNPAGGTINIPLTVSPLSTTVSAASGSYTFSGDLLAGSGPLNKSGSGTLTLASTNSYSGATVVNGGTLTANGSGTLGGSTNFTVATGATLQLNGTNAGGYKWPAAPATLTGAGTVNIPLNGQSNVGSRFDMSAFTGNLNISGGMMGVNEPLSPGFVSPVNGTINVGNATTLYLGWTGFVLNTTVRLNSGTDNGENLGVLRASNGTLNGALILGANSKIGADPTLIINAVISDGGNGFGFTQVANGTVTLTATNTYTGPTTVNSGATLKCDIPNALGSGPLSISGKVNLNFVGNKTVPSLTLGGVAKASGVYGSSASPAPPANQDDARFAGTGTVTVVVVAPKTVLWNVAGGGDWNLTTPNWLEQPSGPGTMFANGDTAIFSNTAGGTINIPSTVSPLATTVSAASGSYTFSGGPLAGGSLTKSGLGSLTLASTNSYSGSTAVNGGTLVVNGNGAVGGSTSFSVATGATLQLNGTNAGGYKWPAAPATLTGAGTVNIPLSGQTNVGNNFDMSAFTGTLNLTSTNGMMAVNSFFSPGFTAPPNGTINIGNNTTLYLGWQGTTYTTTVKLSGGTDNGEGYGVLRGDNATLNGAVILATNSTIGTAGGSLTINAVISDGGSGFGFTQVASGTVTLTAANTYTGPTTVNNGATLKCDTSGSLGGGALSINGKVNLNFAGNKTVASLTLAGVAKASGVYGSSASPAPPANQDDARFAGTGTVTVGGDYSTWAAVYLPADVSNPAADNDGDGMTNQQEYAFGLNPTLGTSVSPITAQLDAVTGNFQYTRRATPAATGLTYTVLTSTNLVAWAAGGATETGFTTAGNIQTVTVHVTAPAVDGKLFVRVEAAPAP